MATPRSSRRTGLGFVVAALALLTSAAPTLALSVGPTKVLRHAPFEIDAGSVSTRHDDIATGWRETQGGGYFNYVRWSNDGGHSWRPKVAIGQGDFNYGGTAEICGGFVASLTGPTSNLRLVLNSLDGGIQHSRDLFAPGTEGSSRSANLACMGDRRLVIVRSDETTGHLKVGFVPLVEALSTDLRDLGPNDANSGVQVVGTGRDAYVTWVRDGTIRSKRFSMANSADASITGYPSEQLGAGASPFIGASGSRVAVAYNRGQDLRLRVSHDQGATFGPSEILVDGTGSTSAGSIGADVLSDNIFVAAVTFDSNVGVASFGVFSTNDGATWASTPTHPGGFLRGAFFRHVGLFLIGEMWDEQFSSPPERLRFHVVTP